MRNALDRQFFCIVLLVVTGCLVRAVAADSLEEVVRHNYPHGVPDAAVASFSKEDVPKLVELLRDAGNVRWFANIVELLGRLGGGAASVELRSFYSERYHELNAPGPVASLDQVWLVTALHKVPSSLADLARSGDRAAYEFLCKLADPIKCESMPRMNELKGQAFRVAKRRFIEDGVRGLRKVGDERAHAFLGALIESNAGEDEVLFENGLSIQGYFKRELSVIESSRQQRESVPSSDELHQHQPEKRD